MVFNYCSTILPSRPQQSSESSSPDPSGGGGPSGKAHTHRANRTFAAFAAPGEAGGRGHKSGRSSTTGAGVQSNLTRFVSNKYTDKASHVARYPILAPHPVSHKVWPPRSVSGQSPVIGCCMCACTELQKSNCSCPELPGLTSSLYEGLDPVAALASREHHPFNSLYTITCFLCPGALSS